MPVNLPQLTSLRFFAAVWVVLFHYWPDLSPAGSPTLVAKGYLGVEVFFTLSGFILAHVYLQAFGEGAFRYGAFIWARLARIYPLHLITLIAIGLLATAAGWMGVRLIHPVAYWPSLPANLLLVQTWGFTGTAAWNHPSWSISAEWFAYLTFPAFAWAAWRLRRRPILAIAAALLLILGAYDVLPGLGLALSKTTPVWSLARIVTCFAFGCALDLAFRAQTIGSARAGGWMAAAGLALLLAAVLVGRSDAAVIAAGGGVILGLAALARQGSRVLAHPALVYLGEVSFAVYMVAIPWRLALGGLAGKLLHLPAQAAWPLWLWSLLVVGVLPAAMLAHHLVERPARVMMRSLAHLHPRAPREEALAG